MLTVMVGTWEQDCDVHRRAAYIGGRWVPVGGDDLQLVDPATEEVIGVACDADEAAIDRAVHAARAAFDAGDWSSRSVAERLEILAAVIDAITGAGEDFARWQTMQMGAPITVTRLLVGGCSRMFRAYADAAERVAWSYLRRDAVGTALVTRQPFGVVGIVIPWNGPLSSLAAKVLPALIAGCSVVVKPAPQTPLEAGRFAELCSAAGVPDGVVNVVTGGVRAGQALVTHPGVDRVSFTGSTTAGRRVGQICGGRLARVSLELGGKSAGLVLPDAPIEPTVRELTNGNFFNSGQICVALSRVLLPANRHDEFVDALCQAGRSMIVGDPRRDTTQLGPLVSAAQRSRVEDAVASGRRAGARLVLGGGRPAGLVRGWYAEPTILTGVDPDMQIARHEIFGPVMCVLRYDTVDQAITMANDSEYGLHGAVFSEDPEAALAVARRLRAGTVSVNTANLTPSTPYGGVRSSGVGREHGREGLESFLDHYAYVVPEAMVEGLQASGIEVA